MKKYLIIFTFTLFLMSCSNSDNGLEIVEKYIHSVENNDAKTMETLLADKYIGYGPSFGDSITKPLALKNWEASMGDIYESIEYKKSRNALVEVVSGENKGNWVSNWAELHIKYKKDNYEVDIWANTIYKIENNQIVKSYTFYNEADVLRQLDYVYINSKFLE
ncbi:nuclear transport factor 2 family protein [Urechidicola vernalis]|uniref:Nuclear transport factor 2 family protein n=1 Tax=Urechidicola vernalis TaxID=3075600 RepID=A0ABU2Y4G6_9FLAO|nr:hypothetical protein [Urechidicola sp. P050]MDT0553086.1 hypothetical protein [Urechidicola sp. P050]